MMIDVPSSNQVVAASNDVIYRIDVTDCSETDGVTMPETTQNFYFMANIDSIDACFVGKEKTSVPILARVNFAPIKNPTIAGQGGTYAIDNINDNFVFMYKSNNPRRIRHYDIST